MKFKVNEKSPAATKQQDYLNNKNIYLPLLYHK